MQVPDYAKSEFSAPTSDFFLPEIIPGASWTTLKILT